jgi:hypothetical protein
LGKKAFTAAGPSAVKGTLMLGDNRKHIIGFHHWIDNNNTAAIQEASIEQERLVIGQTYKFYGLKAVSNATDKYAPSNVRCICLKPQHIKACEQLCIVPINSSV